MKCDDVVAFIYPYLDGEFDPEDAAELEAHLAECPSCRARVDAERRFLQELRSVRDELPMQAPESLKARISDALAREAREPWWRMLTGYVARHPLPLVAGLAAVAAMLLWPSQGPDPIIEHLVAEHEADIPVEVAGPEPGRIQRYYAKRLPFSVHVPVFKAGHAAVLGGRVDRFGERPSAKVVYDVDGHKVTLVAFDGDEIWRHIPPPPDHRWVLQKVDDYSVALYRTPKVTYGVTSRMSPPKLERIVRQASFTP